MSEVPLYLENVVVEGEAVRRACWKEDILDQLRESSVMSPTGDHFDPILGVRTNLGIECSF
jgi:hypothetical protein